MGQKSSKFHEMCEIHQLEPRMTRSIADEDLLDPGSTTERRDSQSKPKFFMNCQNGSHIVLPQLNKLGWERSTNINDLQNCVLIWTETVSQQNYENFKESECMMNHIPNCGIFCNKLGLLLSLRSSAEKIGCTGNQDDPLSFIPETYWLGDPEDRQKFLNRLTDNQIWIMKPCGSNQGKGISLIRSKDEFHKMMEQVKSEKSEEDRIIQRYITSPLLINKRKFDIRCYLMIASTTPYLVLFAPGYIRLSLNKYNVEDSSLITHLTNQYIQKRDPAYSSSKEDSVWTFPMFNEYVNKEVAAEKKLPQNWAIRCLLPEMRKITKRVFNAVKDKLVCRMGFFEIYGMDFMIDENMKVWLIEINTNPAMTTNCEVLKQVIPPVVKQFINISVECFEKARRYQSLLPIHGICPRNSLKDRDISWNVLLNDTPKCFGNLGLPPTFSLLYSEKVSSAISRQADCYKVSLDPWVPPKPTHLPTSSVVLNTDSVNVYKSDRLGKNKSFKHSTSLINLEDIATKYSNPLFKKGPTKSSLKQVTSLPEIHGAKNILNENNNEDIRKSDSEENWKPEINFYERLRRTPRNVTESENRRQVLQGIEVRPMQVRFI